MPDSLPAYLAQCIETMEFLTAQAEDVLASRNTETLIETYRDLLAGLRSARRAAAGDRSRKSHTPDVLIWVAEFADMIDALPNRGSVRARVPDSQKIAEASAVRDHVGIVLAAFRARLATVNRDC